MDALKSLFSNINIGDGAKKALSNIKEDFQKSFKIAKPDLDIDTHPADPTVLVVSINAQAQAKIPFAGGLTLAFHNANIGRLEGNENPPQSLETPNGN